MKEELKQAVQDEKKKLREMTIKEKADYVWEYYKMHIISVIIFVAIAGSIINTVWINPPKKTFINFVYYRAYINDTILRSFADHLTEVLVTDKENEAVYFTNFYLSDEAYSEMDLAMAQKFAAMTASRELDVIVVDELDFIDMNGVGMFKDLNDVFSKDELAAFKDRIMTYTDEETGIIAPYAIRVDENMLLDEYDLPSEGYMIGIMSNTEKIDNAKGTLQYILRYQSTILQKNTDHPIIKEKYDEPNG